ncbi:hypothetical protein K1X84_05535 [bacterium]|nr:hypothetical protein [bacterium]
MKFTIFLILVLPLNAQFFPDPTNAEFVLATPDWIVWRTYKQIIDSNNIIDDRPSGIRTYYIQSEPGAQGWPVNKETVGMIETFNPIWVWKNGTTISWDLFMSYSSKGEVVYLNDTTTHFKGATELPTLRHIFEKGLVFIVPKSDVTLESVHPLYFVPWSWNNQLLNYRNAKQVSDDFGIPYWSGRVLSSENAIASMRAGVIFIYDLQKQKLDSVKTDRYMRDLVVMDDRRLIIQSDTCLIVYDRVTKNITDIPFPEKLIAVAVRGTSFYGFVPTSEEAETTSFDLVKMDVSNRSKSIVLQLTEANDRLGGSAMYPIHFIRNNYLWVWKNGHWEKLKL